MKVMKCRKPYLGRIHILYFTVTNGEHLSSIVIKGYPHHIADSWEERLSVAERLPEVVSNAVVRAYSFTALYSNTYNFVPSLLNDKEFG
jgi:hypothetical protein